MSFRDDIAGGLEELNEAITGGPETGTFTWKDTVEIPCVPGMIGRSAVAVPGGHEIVVQASILVLHSNFLSADSTIHTVDSELYTVDNNRPHPVAGRTLTYRGKEYRILTVLASPCRTYYKLDLADKNSGR